MDEYALDEPTKYLTLHEWTRVVPDDEPDVVAVGQTEWALEIIPHFSDIINRDFNLTTEVD